MLRIVGVSKCFGALKALRSVDLVIEPGQIHGIIGPNGSGKTTLFDCITGILKPEQGRVYLEGQDISELAPQRIARLGIRRTFQAGGLVPDLTVLQNVMTGAHHLSAREVMETFLRPPWRGPRKEGELKARALETLELVHMARDAHRWAGDLVWAERQYVQIARAMVAQPRLLLLDEPVSGMGLRETAGISDLISRMRDRGITVAVISHHMRMLMNLADWVTVLNFGEKICAGRPAAVQRDPRVLEAYLGSS